MCVYTTTGGLKATFLSSYIHTVIIYVALCIFAFTVYATGSDLGSPSKVSPLCVVMAQAYSWLAILHNGYYLRAGLAFTVNTII